MPMANVPPYGCCVPVRRVHQGSSTTKLAQEFFAVIDVVGANLA